MQQPTPPARPVPLIDHLIVNVRRKMAEAAHHFGRLGFALTPLGRHTLGTVNHLAVFGNDYLELLGAPPEALARTDVPDWPEGLAGLVFATHDADAVHAGLVAAGAPVLPPLAFSRPVELPGGARDAAFRIVRIAREASPAGRMFFCGHLTRELVWRDEWRHHPNGALGIMEVVIAAEEPQVYGRLFRTLFGTDAVRERPGGLRLAAGLATVSVVTPAELTRRFGDAAPEAAGRTAWMAAAVLRTASHERSMSALRTGGIPGVRETEEGLVVPAAEALGAALVFREG